jgi:hypothetical protein
MAMTRKPLVLLYDRSADANTRPDTVPCAVRFDEDSSLWSGKEEPTERELAPYAVRPELPLARDEATVAYPLSPASTQDHRISEVRLASTPPAAPRSGPRHSVPPIPAAPAAPAIANYLTPGSGDDGPTTSLEPTNGGGEQRKGAPLPSATRPPQRWLLALVVLVAVIPAFLFGMSLGSGRLQRATQAFFGTTSATAVPPGPKHVPASRPPPSAALHPSGSVPVRPAREVPAVRFEDLALDQPGQPAPPASAEPDERGRRSKIKGREKH